MQARSSGHLLVIEKRVEKACFCRVWRGFDHWGQRRGRGLDGHEEDRRRNRVRWRGGGGSVRDRVNSAWIRPVGIIGRDARHFDATLASFLYQLSSFTMVRITTLSEAYTHLGLEEVSISVFPKHDWFLPISCCFTVMQFNHCKGEI